MFNSIQFVTGSNLWITSEEADSVSTALINGSTFVQVSRLGKTFNASQISNVGPSQIFFDPLVFGGEFSFAFNGLWSRNNGNEYRYNQGWKMARGEFDLGMSFDDYIASMSVITQTNKAQSILSKNSVSPA